jgi:hypothetical protein|tara:strand:+ start:4067 stop:4345 length:279 start_codon:yes stop_codon:yes gene_type:complete
VNQALPVMLDRPKTHKGDMMTAPDTVETRNLEHVALVRRVGLAIVFVIGGMYKLSGLLSDATHDSIVAGYTAANGYINQFFLDYLFTGNIGE